MINTYAEKYRLVDQFNSTYWSGRDCDVYLGDVYLDEMVQLNFAIMEKVQPLYHYSSYTPTVIYHGSRIVTGEISSNYKQSGYWFSLLERLRQGDVFRTLLAPDNQNPMNYTDAVPGGLPSNPANLTGEALKQYVKGYQEKQNTNSEAAIASIYNGTYKAIVQNNAGMYEIPGGMDLTILFGGHLDSSQILRYSTDNGYVERGTIFTDGNEYRPLTGLKILGIELSGTQIQTDDSGRPIIETMSFMAKSIVPVSGEQVKGFKKNV